MTSSSSRHVTVTSCSDRDFPFRFHRGGVHVPVAPRRRPADDGGELHARRLAGYDRGRKAVDRLPGQAQAGQRSGQARQGAEGARQASAARTTTAR